MSLPSTAHAAGLCTRADGVFMATLALGTCFMLALLQGSSGSGGAFGLCALLCLAWLLAHFVTTTFSIDPTGTRLILTRSTPLGGCWRHEVPLAEIADVYGSTSGKAVYDLEAFMRDGGVVPLSLPMVRLSRADELAAALRERLAVTKSDPLETLAATPMSADELPRWVGFVVYGVGAVVVVAFAWVFLKSLFGHW